MVGADIAEVSVDTKLRFQQPRCGMPYALLVSWLSLLTGSYEHKTYNMSETTSPVTTTAPTPCACAAAPKAQPAAAPAAQPQAQPAAAPAPAAPKAGKRNQRKR